jgi:hypothetical protein
MQENFFIVRNDLKVFKNIDLGEKKNIENCSASIIYREGNRGIEHKKKI